MKAKIRFDMKVRVICDDDTGLEFEKGIEAEIGSNLLGVTDDVKIQMILQTLPQLLFAGINYTGGTEFAILDKENKPKSIHRFVPYDPKTDELKEIQAEESKVETEEKPKSKLILLP